MTTREKIIKCIESVNPFACYRRYKMRRRLVNKNISFFTPNCMGGILFHDLNLKFKSPTVNLMLSQKDFIKLMLNLNEYLSKEFEFFIKEGFKCPCAKLGDITVHFTHYDSEKEAVEKWKSRASRIEEDNIFIFAQERDGLSKTEILELAKLPVKGIVVFTAHKYDDIPYAVYIEKYETEGQVGNILERNIFNDSREYERYFDFVKWFNEANGFPFDNSKFIK